MNNSSNTWITENLLFKNQNQRYYYDFGTGIKVERDEVKKEREALLNAASGSSNKPKKQEKDEFLEGFDDPYGEKREQERQRKEQERKERLAKIRENVDKRNWSSQSEADPFLDGFNGASNEQRVKFPNTQLQAKPLAFPNTQLQAKPQDYDLRFLNTELRAAPIDMNLKFPNTQLHTNPKKLAAVFSNTEFSASPKNIDYDNAFREGFNDPYGEKEEKSGWQKFLDGASVALTGASFVPGLDTATNIAQTVVDLLRGDFGSAALDIAGVFPLVGEPADFAKVARIAEKTSDGAKVANAFVDGTKAVEVFDDAYDAAKAAEGFKKLKPSQLTTTHDITLSKRQLEELVQDIQENGILEPIKVVKYNGGLYVVDGHHRLRAARQLKLDDVPVQEVSLPYKGYKDINDLLWPD